VRVINNPQFFVGRIYFYDENVNAALLAIRKDVG
jgi:hypothetical protein